VEIVSVWDYHPLSGIFLVCFFLPLFTNIVKRAAGRFCENEESAPQRYGRIAAMGSYIGYY